MGWRHCVRLVWLIVALGGFLVSPCADAWAAGGDADHVMVVGTKVAPPFAIKSDNGTWSGISIELWRRLAHTLHFKYRFKEVPLDGLINGTSAHKLDAALAAITVTAAREDSVDFSQPYYSTGLGISVRRVSVFNWLTLAEGLFSLKLLEMLVLLVSAIVLVGFIIWLIERQHTEHFSGGVREGLGSSVMWTARTLSQSLPDNGPTTLPGRIIGVTWFVLAVTSVAVFTAGLTTYFTTHQLQGYVRGVQDLYSVRVGTVANTAAVDFLADRHIRFKTFPNAEAGLRAVDTGSLDAFVFDKALMSWFVHDEYADSLDVLNAQFDPQSYAIALPVGSPLREAIDRTLLHIIETQWWRDVQARYLGAD